MVTFLKNIIVLSVLLPVSLTAGHRFLPAFYAVSSNSITVFNSKINEINKTILIKDYLKQAYRGHYASSSHNMETFIHRLHEISDLNILEIGEKHQVYAGSVISINRFREKYEEALKHDELTDLNMVMYFATSNHSLNQFMRRYNEITGIDNSEISGTGCLLYARADISINSFIAKIKEYRE